MPAISGVVEQSSHPHRERDDSLPVSYAGALRLRNSGLVAVDFFNMVPDDYGAEEEGTAASDREGVEIPSSRVRVTAEHLSELQETVDPPTDSENFGIDLYQQAVRIQ